MSFQYSSKLDITTKHLLEVNKGSLDILPEFDCVTNQLILDLYDFKEEIVLAHTKLFVNGEMQLYTKIFF